MDAKHNVYRLLRIARDKRVDENTLFYFRDPKNKPGTFEKFLLKLLERISALEQ